MAYRNAPYVQPAKKGRYAWCACGESAKAPFCDGSHAVKNTGKTPRVVELDADKTVAWCGCGKSAKAPFCDGSHAKG